MIYSGIVNIPIPADFDGVYLNFTDTTLPGSNGATSTSEPVGWNGLNFTFGGSGIYNTPNFQLVRLSATQDSTVANVALYSTVGPSSIFGTGFNASLDHLADPGGTFTDGVDVKFSPDGTAGPYYGWMQVKLTTDVNGWAYSTTANTAVMVPEPVHYTAGTMVALAGFGILRRCRSRKVTPA